MQQKESNVIQDVIARWHGFLSSKDPAALDALLDDNVVFYSPVVFTPQVGKAITSLYLMAAGKALPGDPAGSPGANDDRAHDDGRFRYTKQVLSGDTAVLEFETTVEGKYVNGVDIIRCNAHGKIVEFRVMVRPLQGLNAVHLQMASTLEAMKSAQAD